MSGPKEDDSGEGRSSGRSARPGSDDDPARNSVLLFSSRQSELSRLQYALEDEGFVVSASSDPCELIQIARSNNHQLVLLNFDAVTREALSLCRELSSLVPFQNLPTIVLAGFDNRAIANELRRLGVSHYFRKPISRSLLLRTVQGSLEAITYFHSNGQVLSRLSGEDPAG